MTGFGISLEHILIITRIRLLSVSRGLYVIYVNTNTVRNIGNIQLEINNDPNTYVLANFEINYIPSVAREQAT